MAQRFQIEDIEVQDSTGIVFRATDLETQRTVAVRRFFPFGPNGGGLNAEEQVDYTSALEHLKEIEHPTLRAIISGGCDAVDGMPFIATEWVEGGALSSILHQRSLSPPEAVVLLTHALEASEALSAVLGREGVWIETDPHVIIIGARETHRPVTFWISPMRWLGQTSGQQGFEPLVALTESVMGWEPGGRGSHAATGLGKWLEWLRGAGRQAGLREVRERLVASQRANSSPVATRRVPQTTHSGKPARKAARSRSAALVWILSACILTVFGLTGWILIQKNKEKVAALSGQLEMESVSRIASVPLEPTMVPDTRLETEVVATGQSPAADRDFRERSPEAVTRMFKDGMVRQQQEEAVLQARRDEVRKRGFYLSDDADLLLEMKGSRITFEGRLVSARFSDSGKTFYLEFTANDPKSVPRGVISRNDLTSEMPAGYFQQLTGRKIRIKGEARKFMNRPEITIRTPKDVEVVP